MPVTNTVCIFHGRDSSPEGRKIVALSAVARRRGWKTVVPDFSGIPDPDERVRHFLDTFEPPPGRLILAGSSMGGYVAIEASRVCKPDALFLMAPAIYVRGYGQFNPEPEAGRITVVHGWDDQLIDPACAVRFADKFRTDLHLLNDGHELYQSISFIESTFGGLLDSLARTTRLAGMVPAL